MEDPPGGRESAGDADALWLAVPFIIVAALCLLALADLPYGFYRFLRLAVTAGAVWGVVTLRLPRSGLAWAWALVALLFNPIIPVHLDRETWAPIDLAVAVLAGLTAVVVALKAGGQLRWWKW